MERSEKKHIRDAVSFAERMSEAGVINKEELAVLLAAAIVAEFTHNFESKSKTQENKLERKLDKLDRLMA